MAVSPEAYAQHMLAEIQLENLELDIENFIQSVKRTKRHNRSHPRQPATESLDARLQRLHSDCQQLGVCAPQVNCCSDACRDRACTALPQTNLFSDGAAEPMSDVGGSTDLPTQQSAGDDNEPTEMYNFDVEVEELTAEMEALKRKNREGIQGCVAQTQHSSCN